MIFDRAEGTNKAILTSLKAVGTNPAAMAVWAALIAVLTVLGFATFLLGLAIVLPLLGHATGMPTGTSSFAGIDQNDAAERRGRTARRRDSERPSRPGERQGALSGSNGGPIKEAAG
jgi:hypothetical protein